MADKIATVPGRFYLNFLAAYPFTTIINMIAKTHNATVKLYQNVSQSAKKNRKMGGKKKLGGGGWRGILLLPLRGPTRQKYWKKQAVYAKGSDILSK